MQLLDFHERFRSTACLLVLLVALLLPAVSLGEQTPSGDSDEPISPRLAHPLAFDAHLGLGTPLGFGGGSFDYSASRWFGVMAGIGVGDIGPQFAIMPRAQILMDRLGLHVGAGVSGGPDRWDEGFIAMMHGGVAKRSTFAMWANGQIGTDYQFESQWRIGGYVGGTMLLNPSSYECSDETSHHCTVDHADDPGTEIYPYLGISTGYAF